MRLAVAATPDVAIPTLDWLLDSDHELALIITQPDRPVGRGRTLTSSIISRWASEHLIPVVKPENPDDLKDVISDVDLVITIGFGVLLPESLLVLPKYGFLNLHFSLLPAYRGAAPVQRALEKGETITGVTVFQLDKGMDTGAIYTQRATLIEPGWRALELFQHLSLLGVSALCDALDMIESGQSPRAQVGAFSLAPKINKEQARIDFNLDAAEIVNKIRAFTPSPGSWTRWNGEIFKISNAISAQGIALPPGQVLIIGSSVFIACGNQQAIEILEVTPSGKNEMKAIDWSRGARLLGGEFFG